LAVKGENIMAATEIDLVKPSETPRTTSVLTWLASLLACAYFAWMGISLYRSTAVFIDMFSSMGVDLPLSTRIVVTSYHFLYPVLFGGMAVLVITKQFFVREKRWVSVSITLMAMVLVSLISEVITSTLYRPINDLIEKLGK
jgi:Na+/H+-translocating membrane pyrophosphatase